MSKKLTPWFPGSVKPVHVGSYEVRLWDKWCNEYASTGTYQWNGKYWSAYGERTAGMDRPGWHPKDQWRGLAEQPK